MQKIMGKAVQLSRIQSVVKGALTLREALTRVSNQFAPIEVNLFRGMLAYFDAQSYCEVSEVHQHYVEYFNKARNKTRCEIADLLVVSFSEKRDFMRATFIQAKRETDIQPRNKFRFHLAANQYQLLRNCPIIDPKGTGLPANILRDACSDAISSYGVFYWNGRSYEFAYELTGMLNPVYPSRQTGSMICYFGTTDSIGGSACRISQQSLQYCGTPFGRCTPILFSSIDTTDFELALSHGLIGSPIMGTLASQLSQFINSLHADTSSKHASAFANFVTKNQDFWKNMDNGMHYIANRRDDNRRGENEESNIEWMMPRYIMLVDADKAEERNPE